MPALLKSPDARVVSVSSSAHLFASTVDWDDLNAQVPGAYAPWKAYGLSKLSNIFFAKALQKRVDQKGGIVRLGRSRSGGWRMLARRAGAVFWVVLFSLCFRGPAPPRFAVSFWSMDAVAAHLRPGHSTHLCQTIFSSDAFLHTSSLLRQVNQSQSQR